MEAKKAMRIWLTRKRNLWLAFFLLAALSYGTVRFYKEITMPAPLVFLIPDSYIGPVFFFFGQADGVDVKSDPLGKAVWVPENGVVKLKAPVDEVMGDSTPGHRATYMVSVSKTGERKILKMHGDAAQDDDDKWFTFYFDENTQIHKFPTASESGKSRFYYFTDVQKNEPMVFNHGSCSHQDFIPDNDATAEAPACGKFLVVSPNQYLTLPDWMWKNLQHAYSSIQSFETEANQRVQLKKEYYTPEQPALKQPDAPLREKAGQPSPKTGVWESMDAAPVQRIFKAGEIMPNLKSAYGLTVWQWLRDS
ncbi:hypothetical protein [Collimonas fungivorans]|nr:hypothetical protein [Collimonas fungivorans]